MSKKIKVILTIIIVIIVAGIAVFVADKISNGKIRNLFSGSEGEVTTVTESTLEKVVKQSKLNTAKLFYKSYATDYGVENKPDYYVAYSGTIKAGFNTEDVKLSLDKENHTLAIYLPKIKITEANVDHSSLDVITKGYDPSDNEAYNLAYNDLNEKAESNGELLDMATQNAKNVEKALVEPILNSGNEQYEVTVYSYEDINGNGETESSSDTTGMEENKNE